MRIVKLLKTSSALRHAVSQGAAMRLAARAPTPRTAQLRSIPGALTSVAKGVRTGIGHESPT
jgi:hypothetical protein